MAETGGLIPSAVEVPAVHCHRVGVVDQERVWRELAQIGDDLAYDRGGAQEAEDAARSQSIADGLVDPVAAGNLDVVLVRPPARRPGR